MEVGDGEAEAGGGLEAACVVHCISKMFDGEKGKGDLPEGVCIRIAGGANG